jgi:hypothetical protein
MVFHVNQEQMMRLILNDIQKPKKLLTPEQRKSFVFKLLLFGLFLLVLGTAGFFLGFIYRKAFTLAGVNFRDVQTYSIAVGFGGILIYIITGAILKINLRLTTFYKLVTLVKDEVYDPPNKQDHTKHIASLLKHLDDEWRLLKDVQPSFSENHIDQVLVGPKGIYALRYLNENPRRKKFVDPGPVLAETSRALSKDLKRRVTPLLIFQRNSEHYESPSKVTALDSPDVAKWLQEQENFPPEELPEVQKQVYDLIRPKMLPAR